MIEHVARICLVLALGDLLPPLRCFVKKFFFLSRWLTTTRSACNDNALFFIETKYNWKTKVKCLNTLKLANIWIQDKPELSRFLRKCRYNGAQNIWNCGFTFRWQFLDETLWFLPGGGCAVLGRWPELVVWLLLLRRSANQRLQQNCSQSKVGLN